MGMIRVTEGVVIGKAFKDTDGTEKLPEGFVGR